MRACTRLNQLNRRTPLCRPLGQPQRLLTRPHYWPNWIRLLRHPQLRAISRNNNKTTTASTTTTTTTVLLRPRRPRRPPSRTITTFNSLRSIDLWVRGRNSGSNSTGAPTRVPRMRGFSSAEAERRSPRSSWSIWRRSSRTANIPIWRPAKNCPAGRTSAKPESRWASPLRSVFRRY